MMSRRIGFAVVVAAALVPACKKKREAEPTTSVTERKPITDPARPEEAKPTVEPAKAVQPDDPPPPPPTEETPVPGSRDVPGERGVPLDRQVLGSLPHPFGALEVIKPGASREDILTALPNARRDGDERIVVPLGVDDLVAHVDIDFAGHLDVVRITVPAGTEELLAQAWGKPTANGSWFDRKKRWRADLDGTELMIGPFTPLAEVAGKGPDGLAEKQAILGATPDELTARFGARARVFDAENDDGEKTGEKRVEVLMPATDVCKYYTHVEGELAGGRVAKLHVEQCFDDESQRKVALASLEKAWGRAVPARSAQDLPVFTFTGVPGRKIEMTLGDVFDGTGWTITIAR